VPQPSAADFRQRLHVVVIGDRSLLLIANNSTPSLLTMTNVTKQIGMKRTSSESLSQAAALKSDPGALTSKKGFSDSKKSNTD
jgi:hypothetical protein